MEERKVLRVGVYNNFNFTEKELAEVRKAEKEGYLPFVNSNSFVTIKGDYPSILTINPYLDSFVEPVGDLGNIKACRIKVVPEGTPLVEEAIQRSIAWCADHGIPMLFTFMRFASKASLQTYVSVDAWSSYEFRGSYWRLKKDSKMRLASDLMDNATRRGAAELVHYCDLMEEGCPSCKNCAKLTYGIDTDEISGLTLSCSGDSKGECLFHCPDCWAKKLAKIATFKLDEVTQNSKQKGKKH
jgi:hypothetical protein